MFYGYDSSMNMLSRNVSYNPLSRAQEKVEATKRQEAKEGLRYDTGKTQFELVPPEWVTVLAEILTMGATKYAPRNWEKGMKKSRMIGSLFRHLFARLRGEYYDSESKKPHLGHVAWNALALMSYDLRGIGEDDLTETVSEAACGKITKVD